jgi:single-strand DNA-binding protein
MSRSVNKVLLIGNLGKDPELKYTPNGTAVANFSIATTERYKGQDGEFRENTEWHNLVCWRRLAEIAGEYLKRGSKIYIEGKLKTRNWEGQDGKKIYRTEVYVDNLIMLDGRQGGSTSTKADSGFEPDQISDDDIPF